MAISSSLIKIYPTAYRGKKADGSLIDPESKFNTEYNIRKPYLALAECNDSSFVISNEYDASKPFKFVINGYYVEIEGSVLSSMSDCWAVIKLEPKGSDTFKAISLSPITGETVDWLDTQDQFTGLDLLSSYPSDLTQYTTIFKILSNGKVPNEAKHKISLSSIHTGQDTSLADYLPITEISASKIGATTSIECVNTKLSNTETKINSNSIELSALNSINIKATGNSDVSISATKKVSLSAAEIELSCTTESLNNLLVKSKTKITKDLVVNNGITADKSIQINDTKSGSTWTAGKLKFAGIADGKGIEFVKSGDVTNGHIIVKRDTISQDTTNNILKAEGGILATGKITANSFYGNSDRRLKENIESYSSEKSILDLDVKKYDYINGPKNQIGCIAQELQEICPELVSENDEGFLTVNDSKVVYLLLNEVKKLRKELDEIKSK